MSGDLENGLLLGQRLFLLVVSSQFLLVGFGLVRIGGDTVGLDLKFFDLRIEVLNVSLEERDLLVGRLDCSVELLDFRIRTVDELQTLLC